MNEADYIQVSNLAKVTCAQKVLNELLSGKEYGVDNDKLAVALSKLDDIETELRNLITIKED